MKRSGMGKRTVQRSQHLDQIRCMFLVRTYITLQPLRSVDAAAPRYSRQRQVFR